MPSMSGGMDTGGMSHGPMPGAMSHADMQKLMDATGADLDQQFLTMMIAHHSGAITMATQETAQGSNPHAKALCRQDHHGSAGGDHHHAGHPEPAIGHGNNRRLGTDRCPAAAVVGG
jgi:hypothetical protein